MAGPLGAAGVAVEVDGSIISSLISAAVEVPFNSIVVGSVEVLSMFSPGSYSNAADKRKTLLMAKAGMGELSKISTRPRSGSLNHNFHLISS